MYKVKYLYKLKICFPLLFQLKVQIIKVGNISYIKIYFYHVLTILKIKIWIYQPYKNVLATVQLSFVVLGLCLDFSLCLDSGCGGSSKKQKTSLFTINNTWALYTGPPGQGWEDSWHILRTVFRRGMGDCGGITCESGPLPPPPSWTATLILGAGPSAFWSLMASWFHLQPQSPPSSIPSAFFKMYLHLIVMCFKLKICLDSLDLDSFVVDQRGS